ncbi:hypothetical protein, partial [Moorena sp. SIO4G3]|uniref:hypothetical protein n=1 Tax=Moorena sp. SIO4G3 TaxID=2607821 RepID=UPI0025E2F6BA
MGETTAVAHGGDHGSSSWGRPRQSLMVRSYRKTGSPCQPCKARVGETTAVAHGGNPLWRRCLPKTAQITLINKF